MLPLLAEESVEKPLVLVAVGTVQLVVAGHVRPGFCELLSDLEWAEVDLPQRSLGNNRVFAHTLVLLVVGDKVLDRSRDALGLETVHIRSGNQTRVRGVFRERLEGSTTNGRTLDVDRWREEADGVSRLGLGGQKGASLRDEFGVKRGADGSGVGQGGCGG